MLQTPSLNGYGSLQNTEDKGTDKPLTEQYLKTLSEKEMKSYLIAKSHLGTSFQLDKSVGFLKWKAANNH